MRLSSRLAPFALCAATLFNPAVAAEDPAADLTPDSQRYFDYHHTATDSIDKVNPRELQLGAAALASLVYLVDKYGL